MCSLKLTVCIVCTSLLQLILHRIFFSFVAHEAWKTLCLGRVLQGQGLAAGLQEALSLHVGSAGPAPLPLIPLCSPA